MKIGYVQLNVKLLLYICAAVFFVSVFSCVGVQKAHAQFAVTDIASTVQTTFTALATAALEEKEIIWDGLFYDIANQALQQMTSDILEWANSGFDGEPVFVTDLLGYLGDIADDIAGDFIYGEDLSALCTPFQLDVRTAIAEEFYDEYHATTKEKTECTIDDIAGGNPEAFLTGTEFSNAGGWSMWFEIALHPENTPLGGKIVGKKALNEKIAAKQDAKEKDYLASGGFISQEVCTEAGCTITTPGSIIRDQVSLSLQAPMLRMIGADEMNEVIGSLFSNLANQAFEGVNGLLGLGGNASFSANAFGADGSESYLDAVRKEQGSNSGGVGGNKVEQALRTETQVLELQLAIIKKLDDISTLFLDTREPFEDDRCWQLEFPDSLSDKLDEIVEEVPTTVNTVATLESMLETYEADTSSKGQLQVLQQLSRIQSEGLLSGKTAVIEYEHYLKNELQSEIDDLEEAIADEEDSC